jgi:hypothetical protein
MAFRGLEQDLRLDPVARPVRLLADQSPVDGVLYGGDDQLQAERLDPAVAVGQDLREVQAGIHVHHGERDPGRGERLARDIEHHDGVLAAREQEARPLHLGGHLAEDVDALRLEVPQVAHHVRPRGATRRRTRRRR